MSLINAIATEVYNTLGPGYHESVYQKAMEVELRLQHVTYESHPTVPIYYKAFQVGSHIPDLIVGNEYIVELKVDPCAKGRAMDQLKRYIDTTSFKKGKLIHFGKDNIYIYDYSEKVNDIDENVNNSSEQPNVVEPTVIYIPDMTD